MRLYRVNSAAAYMVGTQAEAKRDARELKCDWELVEVPTDKEGLIAYLNSHGPAEGVVLLGDDFDVEAPEPPVQRVEPLPASPRPVLDVNATYEATQIEDFILNRASVAQTENILGCIGTRFAELAKKNRDLTAASLLD